MGIKKGTILADTAPTSREILIAALAYAERLGFPVIPLHSVVVGWCTCGNPHCDNQGKHPRISGWQDKATTDKQTIKQWFEQWPQSNIGLPTGQASGFFVLDVDPKDNGHLTMEQITDEYGPLPETVHQITGSGGSHYLFKYHEGIKNKVGMLPGIDIRGSGGFIVASPSIHVCGNRYEWEFSSHPLETPIAEAPQWLFDMVVDKPGQTADKKPSSYWSSVMQGLDEGAGRNSAAASLAGHLFRRYADPPLVVEVMKLWNERNRPPLDEKELQTVIDSIAKKELTRRQGGKY